MSSNDHVSFVAIADTDDTSNINFENGVWLATDQVSVRLFPHSPPWIVKLDVRLLLLSICTLMFGCVLLSPRTENRAARHFGPSSTPFAIATVHVTDLPIGEHGQ